MAMRAQPKPVPICATAARRATQGEGFVDEGEDVADDARTPAAAWSPERCELGAREQAMLAAFEQGYG
jgi:hypothetical protein